MRTFRNCAWIFWEKFAIVKDFLLREVLIYYAFCRSSFTGADSGDSWQQGFILKIRKS